MLISENLQKYNNIQFYFISFIVFACLCFTFSFLFDLFQIHIYRADSAYYIDSYFGKLKREGRWLNYLLFFSYSSIPGKLASFLNLLFIYLFVLIVCYRWTKNFLYASLVALLFIQIPPITVLLMWPLPSLTSYFILFLAALVSPYIPIYLYYPLFGVLFFGAMSNLYYLLPLVHLSLLINDSLKQNIKVLFIKIILPWAFGFIIGYIFLLSILYTLTGQYGIEIASWRLPNHIENIQDLKENVLKSFNFLQDHVTGIFTGTWQNVAMVIALLLGIISTRKEQYIPMVILSLAIIVAHYIIVVPIGINISFRTTTTIYFGFLVLFFLHPAIKKWQYNLLLPIVMFMIFSFYQINHSNLKWYASITNLYYNELLRAVPLPPKLYNGVAFLSSFSEVKKINTILQDKLEIKQGNMEQLNHPSQWKSVGFEAGFKEILFCSQRHKNNPVCKKISKNISSGTLIQPKTSGFYQILGQQDGFLIISLNDDLEKNILK